MPTPGSNSLYILLKFLVDEAGARRAQQAISGIVASGASGAVKQSRAIHAMTQDFEALAKEILRIEDPTKREAFTQRFEQLRMTMNATLGVAGQTEAQLVAAYKAGALEVQRMTEEVKILGAEMSEQLRM